MSGWKNNYQKFTGATGNQSVDAEITGGTVDVQGEYNATPPTLSDTGKDLLQLDVNGNLKNIVQNASIEQVTGEDHNTYNIAVAGKDTAGDVQPVRTTTDGTVHIRNITADIDWDLITPTFASTTDTYVFSKSEETTATIVITYTDATKVVIQTVTKTLV